MSGKPSQSSGTPVKPVINAIRILRYISRHRNAARAAEVAQGLSLNPSTCFNILRTLAGEGMLAFDPATKTYSLSKRLLSLLGLDSVETLQLSLAMPVLSRLAQTYNVAATIWRRISLERMVMVAMEYSPAKLRVDIPAGMRLPLLIGATGRLVAANSDMDKAELEQAFRALRWAVPIGFETYWAQAQLARDRGWAVDEGYSWHGITSVAAPIQNPNGGFSHAFNGTFSLSLCAVTFAGQYQGPEIDRLGEAMAMAARQLSETLYRRTDASADA